MEWERGDNLPGRVMSNLKTAGMRELLETLVAERGLGGDAGNDGDEGSDSVPGGSVPGGSVLGGAGGSTVGEGADLPPAGSWAPVV